MNYQEVQKITEKYLDHFKKKKPVTLVQVGSSLRKEEFMDNSDLDLFLISRNKVKERLKIEYVNDLEVNLIRRSKRQFLKNLNEGIPVDLIALHFGKVIFDNGFLSKLNQKDYLPTEKTAKYWLHTASFNLSDAFYNYSGMIAVYDFFKSLHHAVRDFSRAIIVAKEKKLAEGNKNITRATAKYYPELIDKYNFILNGRRDSERYDGERIVETVRVRDNERGKFLLAAEEFAIKAYQDVLKLKLPKINSIISTAQRKYRIKYFDGYILSPERKEASVLLVLKNGKIKIITVPLKSTSI